MSPIFFALLYLWLPYYGKALAEVLVRSLYFATLIVAWCGAVALFVRESEIVLARKKQREAGRSQRQPSGSASLADYRWSAVCMIAAIIFVVMGALFLIREKCGVNALYGAVTACTLITLRFHPQLNTAPWQSALLEFLASASVSLASVLVFRSEITWQSAVLAMSLASMSAAFSLALEIKLLADRVPRDPKLPVPNVRCTRLLRLHIALLVLGPAGVAAVVFLRGLPDVYLLLLCLIAFFRGHFTALADSERTGTIPPRFAQMTAALFVLYVAGIVILALWGESLTW